MSEAFKPIISDFYYKLPTSGPIDWSDKSNWEKVKRKDAPKWVPHNWVKASNDQIMALGYKRKTHQKLWNEILIKNGIEPHEI